jgi:hypothetical protein
MLEVGNSFGSGNYGIATLFATQKTKPLDFQGVLLNFADRTGLEPATSAVTGRHSNQLNYRSFV